ncbi:MFS transporter [Kitasatospora sp. NE20-6]|uniref:MFS transporter n=1 Tax=Kitasatospora sp. NE20-6 TaxID=2859066 RepID=UPI0034DC4ECE
MPSASRPSRPGMRDVLGRPHVAAMLTSTLVGRLPTAMAPIALLLAVRAEGGSVLVGGILSALFALSAAIGQPLLGRLVDRTRLAPVAAVSAVLSGAAFGALAFLGCTAHPLAGAALTVLAGAMTPPLEAGLRALWPRLVPDPRKQHTAFTLDSVSQEITFIAGPLLATVLCQLVSPTAALAACAVVGTAGSLAVATRTPARWAPTARHAVHWLGPLRSHSLLLLLAAMLCMGTSLGAFHVMALAVGSANGIGWLSGLMSAAQATGSLIGGLLYARAPLSLPLPKQLLWAAGGYALCFTPLLLTAPPLLSVLFSICAGLFVAPLLAITFMLSDRLAPAGTAAEAAAWVVAIIGVGQALGASLTGRLAADGTTAAAAVPVLAAVLTAAVPLLRTTLLAPATTPSERTV